MLAFRTFARKRLPARVLVLSGHSTVVSFFKRKKERRTPVLLFCFLIQSHGFFLAVRSYDEGAAAEPTQDMPPYDEASSALPGASLPGNAGASVEDGASTTYGEMAGSPSGSNTATCAYTSGAGRRCKIILSEQTSVRQSVPLSNPTLSTLFLRVQPLGQVAQRC